MRCSPSVLSSVTAVKHQSIGTLSQQISADCLNTNGAVRSYLNGNIIDLDETESRSSSGRNSSWGKIAASECIILYGSSDREWTAGL